MRRLVLAVVLVLPAFAAGPACRSGPPASAPKKPNVLILLADQWRAQALGHAGDPNVRTPHLDRLAAEGVRFTHAVSSLPVCCPYRASLMTGRRPLSHGVFMNDVPLRDEEVTIAEILAGEGYDTGFIGKWHLDGRGRAAWTPPERRQGFRYWKALECTHDYNRSRYYADTPEPLTWEGYDAIAQTRDAQRYLRERAASGRPFLLVLSWGPPHEPYPTAPQPYRDLYDPARIRLRPNVPDAPAEQVRNDLAGYYAHCTAIDDCVGDLMWTLREAGLSRDTLVVFTSDHGDLLGSQGAHKKQQPYDESIRVPFILRRPGGLGEEGRAREAVLATEDILPTLLGLCGVAIPDRIEGIDFSGYVRGGPDPSDGAALISCVQPFGQWMRARHGAREYRGIRTPRHTYVRDLNGPWLLFDNGQDPYQQHNLAGRPEAAETQRALEAILARKLRQAGDDFLPGPEYLKRWGYAVDATGTVPYK